MAEDPPGRRAAVEALILSLVGAAGVVRFLTPLPDGASGEGVVSVPESEVPAEGALVLPAHGCAIVRDASGFVAFDLGCPHLGCLVTGNASGFACPCHGSRFDPTGAVVTGPAPRGLRRLRLSRVHGSLEVRRG
jgi:Rieske Fe-S protein